VSPSVLTAAARLRLSAGLFAILVSATGLAAPAFAVNEPAGASVPSDPGSGSSSAFTVHGRDQFSNLSVTVSQTKNLIRQVVNVSWTGGAPTVQGGQVFGINYLQMMECWGDDPTAPSFRNQCEFGAFDGDNRAGAWVTSRQVTYGALVDPAEPITLPPGGTGSLNVPFDSVTGDVIKDGPNPFYDQSSSDEVPLGLTTADGTGQTFFETDTAAEAPGLGCGAPETLGGKTVARGCWLVIVPRDNHEVDGTTRNGVTTSNGLQSSPLSMTNWKERLVVPLSFQPVGTSCAIGAAERQTAGDEQITEAMTQWQPTLCQKAGAVYAYSQLTDELSRQILGAPDPELEFVSQPLPAGSTPPGKKPLYAPAALSGLGIAFNIERQSSFSAPKEVRQRNGTRVTSIHLSPRLVAKLLTQSYKDGVAPGATDVNGNPVDLTTDPDFLNLNPDFKALTFSSGIASMLVPLSPSDATDELWAWINADPGARKFLDGAPDPVSGMKVNPNYAGLDLPRSDYPKDDPACQDFAPPMTPLCTLDLFPYASDMHAGARGASRGDLLLRTTWNLNTNPPTWGASPPEQPGFRAVLSVSDVATATRDGLSMASLCDDDGNNCVQPDTAGLLAGAAAMVPSGVDGVVVPPASNLPQGAYPLTTLTYAATIPSELSLKEAKDYAGLLKYIAGPGQQTGILPGELPLGYVPLPDAMRQQTMNAADIILAVANHVPSPSPSPIASSGENITVTVNNPGGLAGGPGGGAVGGPGGGPLGPPHSPAAVSPAPSARIFTASPSPSTVRSLGPPTAARPLGAVRYVLLIALLLGGVAVSAGPGLTVLSRSSRLSSLLRR
jgi:hypothetical protein